MTTTTVTPVRINKPQRTTPRSIRFPTDVAGALTHLAAERGVSVSELVQKAVIAHYFSEIVDQLTAAHAAFEVENPTLPRESAW